MERERALRIVLGVMAVQFLVLGAWAELGPQSFYDDFPGGGRHWISADGPFNEHLVRDFGGLNLRLAPVTPRTVVTPGPSAGGGSPAVATTSGGVARVNGHRDGEDMPVADMLAAVALIAAAVPVPVTADMEGGYGLPGAELASRLIEAGAVGLTWRTPT